MMKVRRTRAAQGSYSTVWTKFMGPISSWIFIFPAHKCRCTEPSVIDKHVQWVVD